MWKIGQIFDGDYGCEERMEGEEPTLSVTLENEKGQQMRVSVTDAWLRERDLDEGREWKTEYFSQISGDIIRKKIRFRGIVQGVGFRYRSRMAAREAGATGWVRNEVDGSVLMEIQGRQGQIDAVISVLSQGRYMRIDGMDVTSLPVDPNDREFEIKESLGDFWGI